MLFVVDPLSLTQNFILKNVLASSNYGNHDIFLATNFESTIVGIATAIGS